MIIPKSFKLMGLDFEVVYDEPCLVNNSNRGEANLRTQQIRLLPPDNMYGYSKQDREQTFCHELTHHLFSVLNLPELRDDERLVDTLGSLIHQFLITNEGNIDEEEKHESI